MPTYKITDESKETRQLCASAITLAAMLLEIKTPPWRTIREASDGEIETAKPIRGKLWVNPQGDVLILLNAAHASDPSRLARTCFHECHHVKTLSGDIERGSAPTDLSVAEGQACFFAESESPRGTYAEVMAGLCERGARFAIEKDMPGTAGVFTDQLTAYLPKTAKTLRQRANALLAINEKIAASNIDMRTSDDVNTRHAANALAMRRENERERQRQLAQRGIEAARLAGEKAKKAAAKTAREAQEHYRRVPTETWDQRTGSWLPTGEFRYFAK